MVIKPQSHPNGFSRNVPKNSSKLRGGYPVLRSAPPTTISRGEAKRLISVATRLIVASEKTQDMDEAENKPESIADKKKSEQKMKYAYDIHGRKYLIKEKSPDEKDSRSKSQHSSYSSFDDQNKNRRPRSAYPPRPPPENRSIERPASSASYDRSDSESDSNSSITSKATESRSAYSGSSYSLTSNASSSDSKHSSKRDGSIGNEYSSPELSEEMKGERKAKATTTTTTTTETQTTTELINDYDPIEQDVDPNAEKVLYRIEVETSPIVGSGTNAPIKLVLHGENGKTKPIQLTSLTRGPLFKQGQKDELEFEAPNVGHIIKIGIGHDSTKPGAEWQLENVLIQNMKLETQYKVENNCWLSAKHNDKKTYRKLYVTSRIPFISARNESTTEDATTNRTIDDQVEPVEAPLDEQSSTERSNCPSATDSKTDSNTTSSQESNYQKFKRVESNNVRVIPIEFKDDSKKDEKSTGVEPMENSTTSSASKSDTNDKLATNSKVSSQDTNSSTAVTETDETDGTTVAVTTTTLGSNRNRVAQQPSEDEGESTIPDSADDILNQPSIHSAIRDKNVDLVTRWIKHDSETLHLTDEKGKTPIMIAAEIGHENITKFLLENNADVEKDSPTGYRPVHLAVINGHTNILKLLFQKDASFTGTTLGENQTVLHLAAKHGHFNCVKWLVQQEKTLLNCKDSNDRTAADVAAEYGHNDIKKYLQAADPDRENEDKLSTIKESDSENDTGSSSSDADSDSDSDTDSNQSSKDTTTVSESLDTRWKKENNDMMEKKHAYDKQQESMKEKNQSFMDAIRQDVD
ncbi:DgyrCDS12440 [Dimorphilus gyrociliatus]|uniref:DgyrCDS12440 n=1 Tax=Dimorphilus gyrociliatus TaxID=2664684 RepID=A0A7I8W6G9_9ANNE|nr:DgyrCDS12440 [Dimorphilus gyrociliatus]